MTYDFTTVIDRRGQDALCVDALGKTFLPGFQPREGFDPIPMWAADMNFATCPAVIEALTQRLQHPILGYFGLREQWYEAIIRWQTLRHGVTGLTADCIGYEGSVMGGVLSALQTVIGPGDKVLIHSPVYTGFTHALRDNGFEAVRSPLVLDENNIWRMDFDHMERQLREQKIHAVILCSPHNPAGRVWERWELERAYALFEQYDVTVVADEIWADLILDGHRHIPSQSISPWAREHTVACYALTKTFNLAGLYAGYHIIYNPTLRDRHRAVAAKTRYNEPHVLSMHALMAAYTDAGMDWTDQLCAVLSRNIGHVCDEMEARFPGVRFCRPQGTHLMFADCEQWCRDHGKTMEQVLWAGRDVGLLWNDGRLFGGTHTLRINWAHPISRVDEALDRMTRYVFCD